MAFDITAAIHGPSAADQPRPERIQLIPLDQIEANDKNFYEISGIRNLAESISIVGLLDPVRVVAEEGRKYRLVSGHRRLAAYQILRDESFGTEYDKIPAIIMSKLDTLDEEFALLTANATARELSYSDKLQQEKAMRETLLAMKAQGRKLPSGLSQYIADSMGVSRNEVSRMHTVNENLVPEAMEKIKGGELNASEAYELARKPEAEQREAVCGKQTSVYQKDEAALEAIRMETNGILSKMDKAAPELCREIQFCGNKKDAVESLKNRYRNTGHFSGYVLAGSPGGIEFGTSMADITAKISYNQVYEYLALWAIRQAAKAEMLQNPEFETGCPCAAGWYTCRLDSPLKYKTLWWTGESWRINESGTADIDSGSIIGWFPVPED